MKILLIGKTGQLGGDILRNGRDHDIIAPDRAELDVRSAASIESAMASYRPDVVINTAAFHNVPDCEIRPSDAFQTNCVAVRDLAEACIRHGSFLVTFSTDYVFDGAKNAPYHEDDAPAPLQIYGITRVAGEFAALSAAPDRVIVIRTCGLYGTSGASSKGGNFVDRRIEDAKKLASLEMGNDQVVSPTCTHDLSIAVMRLLNHADRSPGIYHLVNDGTCTWYEFTRAIYEIMGITIPVQPVDRGGRSGSMRRPLFSALLNKKARDLGITLPPWREALERYLKNKYGR